MKEPSSSCISIACANPTVLAKNTPADEMATFTEAKLFVVSFVTNFFLD